MLRLAAVSIRVPHTLEPDLAPIRVDASWAEAVVVARADDPLEDDAVRLDLDHLAGVFVDEPLDPAEDARGPAAVGRHHPVEDQSPVLVLVVEGRHDFLL